MNETAPPREGAGGSKRGQENLLTPFSFLLTGVANRSIGLSSAATDLIRMNTVGIATALGATQGPSLPPDPPASHRLTTLADLFSD